jgi:hypothetical protein
MEEGGFALDAPPQLFGVYLNTMSGRDHVALYVCRQWTQVRPPALPNLEIVEAGFFPPAAPPDGVTDATRRRLAEMLDGVPPSPEW